MATREQALANLLAEKTKLDALPSRNEKGRIEKDHQWHLIRFAELALNPGPEDLRSEAERVAFAQTMLAKIAR